MSISDTLPNCYEMSNGSSGSFCSGQLLSAKTVRCGALRVSLFLLKQEKWLHPCSPTCRISQLRDIEVANARKWRLGDSKFQNLPTRRTLWDGFGSPRASMHKQYYFIYSSLSYFPAQTSDMVFELCYKPCRAIRRPSSVQAHL
jgi:hypothetical protein